MESDLRAQVVEAMAQADYEGTYSAPGFPAWADITEHERALFRSKARRSLDAALDVLGERWEEWIDHTADYEGLADLPTWEHGLLAVLRAGKGSEE